MQRGLFDALAPEERGFTLGAALLGASSAALRVLGPTASDRIEAALTALNALPRPERAAALAALAADAVAPPPRIEALHPSWIEPLFEGEPAEVMLALAAGQGPNVAAAAESVLRARAEADRGAAPLALDPALLAELRRAAFAELVPLLDEPVGPRASRLVGLPHVALLGELASEGAGLLGRSLSGAAPEAVARAMAGVGRPYADAVAEGARQPLSETERPAVRAAVASVLRSPDVSSGDEGVSSPEVRLATIALPALRAALVAEGAASLARVAGRLPRRLGLVLLTSA